MSPLIWVDSSFLHSGLVCNQTCCGVCRTTTSRDEAFLALSLEIEGVSSPLSLSLSLSRILLKASLL
jgi:hypothetical protein